MDFRTNAKMLRKNCSGKRRGLKNFMPYEKAAFFNADKFVEKMAQFLVAPRCFLNSLRGRKNLTPPEFSADTFCFLVKNAAIFEALRQNEIF